MATVIDLFLVFKATICFVIHYRDNIEHVPEFLVVKISNPNMSNPIMLKVRK